MRRARGPKAHLIHSEHTLHLYHPPPQSSIQNPLQPARISTSGDQGKETGRQEVMGMVSPSAALGLGSSMHQETLTSSQVA